MRYFKTDELGLLPKTILELKELRNEYKRLMKEARNNGQDSEYVKWYNNQMAVILAANSTSDQPVLRLVREKQSD